MQAGQELPRRARLLRPSLTVDLVSVAISAPPSARQLRPEPTVGPQPFGQTPRTAKAEIAGLLQGPPLGRAMPARSRQKGRGGRPRLGPPAVAGRG